MSNDKGGGGFVAGFVIGALIGGAVAVFLAQEDMRDLLVGKAREAGNFAVDATGDLRGKVDDVTGDLRGKVNDVTGDLRDKVSDATSQWQNNAADLYARGKNIVDNARSNFDSSDDAGQRTGD